MAVAGITVARAAEPLGSGQIGHMLAALTLGDGSQCESRTMPLAQVGAVSSTGSASVWSDSEILVACDAELVNTQSQVTELGLPQDAAAARID